MTLALYPTGLWWDGSKGAAKYQWIMNILILPPTLGGKSVWQIEWVPCLQVAWVRPRSIDERRDLTAAEAEACFVFVRKMCAAAHLPR